MKKSLLLALAAFMALGAQAIQVKDAKALNAPLKKQNVTLSQRAESAQATLVKKAKKVTVKEEPMSEAPAGTEYKNLYVQSESYGMGWGDIYYQKVDGGVANVVEGNDGNLYISGPISQAYVWGLGTPYIKCTPLGNNIYSMATPQLYALDYGDPYYIQRLTYDEGEGLYVVDTQNTAIKFKWENHVLTQIDDCFYGLTDATGEWFYMADNEVKMTINEDKVATIPADYDENSVTLTYLDAPSETLARDKKKMASVWVSENELAYLTSLENNLNSSPIAMRQVNNQAVISSGQYMGVDEEYMSHVYMLTGNARVDEGTSFFNYDLTDNLALALDEENEILYANYPQSLIINAGRSNLYIIDEFVAPTIAVAEDNPMTPANPEINEVRHTTSFDIVKFTIPTVDVNGADLDTRSLYYTIYYNDDVYTFTPELFIGFTEPMTVFPYNFADSYYDLYLSESSGITTLYFYDKDYDKLGVQSIYTGGNEEHRSEIVYYSKAPAAINDVNVESTAKVRKYIADGQFIIEKDGIRYNVAGQVIK